jgi:hypothetical protein
MTATKGTHMKPFQCVKLDKALYGLVQAARQFYLKFAQIMGEMGFIKSCADPVYTPNSKWFVFMIVHVDDCYVIGNKRELIQLVKDFGNTGLKVKATTSALDYLSCDIRIDTHNHCAWIG